VRLKEIDDRRKETDAAKSAELLKAAAASTSSLNASTSSTITATQFMKDCPVAFAAVDPNSACIPVAFATPQSSLDPTPSIPPPPTDASLQSLPHVAPACSSAPSADPDFEQTARPFPLKSESQAQPPKPFSLQKNLRTAVPPAPPRVSGGGGGGVAASQDDDFQPEKPVVKRFVKKEVLQSAGVDPKLSDALSTSSFTTNVNACGLPVAAPACSDATPTIPAAAASDAAAAAAVTAEPDKKESLSRIYICSRTHSQLSQLIKGLKTTVYTPSMAILGSREQLCINPTVMLSDTKNEDCSKLIGGGDSSGCSFFQASNVLASHPSMRVVWDIEDIVTKGRQFRACPYFTAKDIAESADVVFCPYTYVIDKLIRESSGISLTNNVVIFDEAHNLEDQCREAASFVVTQALLTASIQVMQTCQHFPNCPSEAENLITVLHAIRMWMDEKQPSMHSDGSSEKILEFVAGQVTHELGSMGLTADGVKVLAKAAKKMNEWHKEVIECNIKTLSTKHSYPNNT
jgi:hypothetical protein